MPVFAGISCEEDVRLGIGAAFAFASIFLRLGVFNPNADGSAEHTDVLECEVFRCMGFCLLGVDGTGREESVFDGATFRFAAAFLATFAETGGDEAIIGDFRFDGFTDEESALIGGGEVSMLDIGGMDGTDEMDAGGGMVEADEVVD